MEKRGQNTNEPTLTISQQWAKAQDAVNHTRQTSNSYFLYEYLHGPGDVVPEMKALICDILDGSFKPKYRPDLARAPTPAMAKQVVKDIGRKLKSDYLPGDLLWTKQVRKLEKQRKKPFETTRDAAVGLAASCFAVSESTFRNLMDGRRKYQRNK